MPTHDTVRFTRVSIIDSHTGGEPTRIVIGGGPELGGGSIADKLNALKQQDEFRSAIVNEPRGSDAMVGAILVEPQDPTCITGIIFFNNVGYLGMCGHGTIGLGATLAHLGRITPGEYRVETTVGIVTLTLHENGEVSVANVPSWRAAKGVKINVPGIGAVTGDVAWGGNWFYLIENHGLELSLANAEQLQEYAWKVRQAINAQGHPEVDHIELFGPPKTQRGNARGYVQCPGKVYDRSPCGTGTSAKLACLAADGKWRENEPWVQESFIGSTFTAHYRWLDRAEGKIAPLVTGSAFVTGEATLLLDERDPFCHGIRV